MLYGWGRKGARMPENETQVDDQYLGDGVYISTDGYHIILDLRQQNESRIALEPRVFQRLLEYAALIAAQQGEAV